MPQNQVLAAYLPERRVTYEQFQEFVLALCLAAFNRLDQAGTGLNEVQLRPVTRAFNVDHELTMRSGFKAIADGDKTRERHRPSTWRVKQVQPRLSNLSLMIRLAGRISGARVMLLHCRQQHTQATPSTGYIRRLYEPCSCQ